MNNTAEYKRLDFSKLNFEPTPISTEESLRDIAPIEWSKDMLNNDDGYTVKPSIYN